MQIKIGDKVRLKKWAHPDKMIKLLSEDYGISVNHGIKMAYEGAIGEVLDYDSYEADVKFDFHTHRISIALLSPLRRKITGHHLTNVFK
jgi:hypothetical protein